MIVILKIDISIFVKICQIGISIFVKNVRNIIKNRENFSDIFGNGGFGKPPAGTRP
jgi:hypothetical protein